MQKKKEEKNKAHGKTKQKGIFFFFFKYCVIEGQSGILGKQTVVRYRKFRLLQQPIRAHDFLGYRTGKKIRKDMEWFE